MGALPADTRLESRNAVQMVVAVGWLGAPSR